MDWYAAKDYCANLKGALYIVSNQTDMEFISKLLNTTGYPSIWVIF